MGKKVFVSYKHKDAAVQYLNGYGGTARAYVDYLIDHRLDDEIYKGEGDEDLSNFKDETIKTHLKDRIHDSSITIVLISPNMKDPFSLEADQWIPWEISYSLKEITRADRVSHTNGILAVVLPDSFGSYQYFITESCNFCKSRQLQTHRLFQILRNNMFNSKDIAQTREQCSYCGCSFHRGAYSYITAVKWNEFLGNKDHYLNSSVVIRDNRKAYNITKEITRGY